jgi:hypothetical protein
MKCPFCHSRLEVWPFQFHTTYGCVAEECVNDDMPRYQITYNNYPTFLISRVFMFNKDIYVVVNYRDNCTVISKLEACLLFDTVQIPRALDVDLKRPFDILPKIRTLMVFS